MKKYLVLYAVAVTALFVCSHRRYRAENRRLVQNQTALAAEAASCPACVRPMPKRSAGWGSKSAGWRPPQRP